MSEREQIFAVGTILLMGILAYAAGMYPVSMLAAIGSVLLVAKFTRKPK